MTATSHSTDEDAHAERVIADAERFLDRADEQLRELEGFSAKLHDVREEAKRAGAKTKRAKLSASRPTGTPLDMLGLGRRAGNALLLVYLGPLFLSWGFDDLVYDPSLELGDQLKAWVMVLGGAVLTAGVLGLTWGAIRTKRTDVFRPGWIGAGVLSLLCGLLALPPVQFALSSLTTTRRP
jgi:hypothetical protein